MDFNDTPEEAAYRGKVRAWLKANAPERPYTGRHQELIGGEDLVEARAWQKKKAAAGYAQIAWPKEWGGPGGTRMQSVIYAQEEANYNVNGAYFVVALGMCLPTVMAFADENAKNRFIGPALRGEEIWCQLFSEPTGGSDVAAARARAVRDGDEWIVNSQKTWTSGAQFADYGMLLARTDPDVPKHKGLTVFWLDMKSPGIEVRPIHQVSGASSFNDVFFTDVRIHDRQRLGPAGGGWNVSIVTLLNERMTGASLGGPDYKFFMDLTRNLLTDRGAALDDPAVREKIADLYIQFEGVLHLNMRLLTAMSRGDAPGSEASIGKLVTANVALDLALSGVEVLDQFGIINDPAYGPMRAMFQTGLLSAPGGRIGGGTDEIMRNIIAERVLGLPGDIRVDKDVAFRDVPAGR
jgi:alkylation response protein AidB-like acyl-CoA dehydrogenase